IRDSGRDCRRVSLPLLWGTSGHNSPRYRLPCCSLLDDAGSGTARYIKQSAGYNPSPMGRAINKTLMTFGSIVLGAGFGLAQQGPPPEKFQQTDIFVTSYK